jgi:hypothetical protein
MWKQNGECNNTKTHKIHLARIVTSTLKQKITKKHKASMQEMKCKM